TVVDAPHTGVGSLILQARESRNLQEVRELVVTKRAFPVNLRCTAEGPDVVVFDLPEIVLCLSICEAEDARGIRLPIDVRYAVRVSIDRHLTGERGTLFELDQRDRGTAVNRSE